MSNFETYELLSGVRCQIVPLSGFVLEKIKDMAAEAHPMPDPEQYERVDETQEGPGRRIPATENKDYRQLVAEVEMQRNMHWQDRVYVLGLDFPDGKGALIKQFKGRLDEMRDVLDGVPEDDWKATLFYCILTSKREQQDLIERILDRRPPEAREVAEKMNSFRAALQGAPANGAHRDAQAVQEAERPASE